VYENRHAEISLKRSRNPDMVYGKPGGRNKGKYEKMNMV
jgi:hypothetical protein